VSGGGRLWAGGRGLSAAGRRWRRGEKNFSEKKSEKIFRLAQKIIARKNRRA
jgi:hypothetical protein